MLILYCESFTTVVYRFVFSLSLNSSSTYFNTILLKISETNLETSQILMELAPYAFL